MGIASLLGEDNPFTQWTDQNQNLLNAIGSGLGQGQNIQSGLSAGLAQVPQAKQLDQQQAEKQKASKLAEQQLNATKNWLQSNHPDLAQMVDAGMPVSEAWQAAMQRMQPQGGPAPTTDIQNYEYAQAHPGFLDFQTQKGGAAETSLTPTWGTDSDPASPTYGQTVLGQLNKAGQFVKTALPPGVSAMDPRALAGEKATGTVDAKTAAAARAALPGAEQMLGITNKAISEVRNNAKGMNEWFGQIGPRGWYVLPGSEMGKFKAASSPTNAQAFMQARNMLKGGGQITDYEGRRAEDAMSRMQAALDSGDQDQYLRALADFEQAVAEGYAKLQATAQGAYAAPSPGAQPPAALTSGNVTSSGVQWSVEP